MKSFIIGRVVEPEIQERKVNGKNRNVCQIGILSGRSCIQFSVFDDSKVFERVVEYADGDQVVAVISTSENKENERYYLDAIGECPSGLRDDMLSLLK